jgi:hypothetical protein
MFSKNMGAAPAVLVRTAGTGRRSRAQSTHAPAGKAGGEDACATQQPQPRGTHQRQRQRVVVAAAPGGRSPLGRLLLGDAAGRGEGRKWGAMASRQQVLNQ